MLQSSVDAHNVSTWQLHNVYICIPEDYGQQIFGHSQMVFGFLFIDLLVPATCVDWLSD